MSLGALLLFGVGAGLVAYGVMREKQPGKAGGFGGGAIPYSSGGTTADSTALRIENVGQGGVIKLMNIGPDLKDFDATVTRRHVYQVNNYEWSELELDTGTEKLWLELAEDDELEIRCSHTKLKLREINVTPDDLERMAADEDGRITYNGITYFFEDAGEATYLKNGDPNLAEQFRYWDFENREGTKLLSIENFGSKSCDVTLAEPVNASQITVYSLTGKSA